MPGQCAGNGVVVSGEAAASDAAFQRRSLRIAGRAARMPDPGFLIGGPVNAARHHFSLTRLGTPEDVAALALEPAMQATFDQSARALAAASDAAPAVQAMAGHASTRWRRGTFPLCKSRAPGAHIVATRPSGAV